MRKGQKNVKFQRPAYAVRTHTNIKMQTSIGNGVEEKGKYKIWKYNNEMPMVKTEARFPLARGPDWIDSVWNVSRSHSESAHRVTASIEWHNTLKFAHTDAARASQPAIETDRQTDRQSHRRLAHTHNTQHACRAINDFTFIMRINVTFISIYWILYM